MAARHLPKELVEAGSRVSAASEAAGLRLAAAAWIYDHALNDWRFYVVSPLVGIIERKRLYSVIANIMRNIDVPEDFSVVDVYLDGTKGFMFNLIGSVVKMENHGQAQFSNCRFNNVLVDAVVYKFDFSKREFRKNDQRKFEEYEKRVRKERSKLKAKSIRVGV